ncbi:MAG: hypothetical protein CUN51_08045 [Candidatus Thermofonsia Clade 1 bacterium]|uniref:DUF86 domain-containing protein n=1 Tax=Candidatus Thermofonsia Clade 1 bacterium TaxID=2364210 RepID=A0A2M8NYI0_9CHLR|nr:MAG: hypothetical protein CUN51_08045 [Candidatus Thermofonsia Clade 1 bacterium]
MLIYIRDIESMRITSIEAITSNRIIELAAMCACEALSETAKRLPQALLDSQPQVDWQNLKSLSDFLIHHYKVSSLTLWNAVQDLPNLKAAVLAMLQSLESTDRPEGA